MRELIIGLFGFFTGFVWAQVENSVPAGTNLNMERNGIMYNNELEESTINLDTITIIEEVTNENTKDSRKKKLHVGRAVREEVKITDQTQTEARGTYKEELKTTAPEYTDTPEGYKAADDDFNRADWDASTQRSQRSPSAEQQMYMDQAVGYFEVAAPASFEHHYFKYVAGNHDTTLFYHLQEAEQLQPDNSDVHTQMAGYYVITDDTAQALVYIDKLIEEDRLKESAMDYSEDVLLSAPENGTLVTHGFDDGYGAYYVQNSSQLRSDVTLVSLDLLQSEAYRNKLEKKGYSIPDTSLIDVQYLEKFCVQNPDKNIAISLTTPKEYFLPIQRNLYVVGLLFEYHQEDYNNFFRNDYLWNEELTKTNVMNPKDETGRQLSANYLPMMLMLQKAYGETGESDKAEELDKISDQVGVQCKKYEQIKKVKASY